MTREEAIKNIKEHCYFANLIPQAKESLDMAIKALEQEPCEDCISREAFINRYREWHKSEYGRTPSDDAIGLRVAKSLPSVQPKPKTEHWIKTKSGWICSECQRKCGARFANQFDYCPNCGAKMESKE